MMMISNPELQRNLWLEVTSNRLISMPLILSIIFFLIYVMHGQELNRDVAGNVVMVYTVLTVFWGARMASESILSEVRNHTWDNQRMSSMSAWTLVWGKLLGSTIYVWYGAFFCLLLYAYSAGVETIQLMKNITLLVSCGLLAQGLAMLSSIMSVRKNTQTNKAVPLRMTLFVSLPVAIMLVLTLNQGIILWYGFSIATFDMVLWSSVSFLCWTWIGNQRLMRAELQSTNSIVVWMLFVIYTMAYIAGFSEPIVALTGFGASFYLLNAFYVAIALTYFMLFSETKTPMSYVVLLNCLKRKKWLAMQFSLPCWIGALILAWLSAIAVAMMDGVVSHMLMVVAILFFVMRDICIVLYINFSEQKQRSDITALLYLAILYVIFPSIFSILGLSSLNVMFRPSLTGENVAISVGAALVECVLVFWLMRQRWKESVKVQSQTV